MPSKPEPIDDELPGDDDYVPALFARNMEEAEEYCELLSDHDIPARAGTDEEPLDQADPDHRAAGRRGMTHGVPVLVPESLLDEASEVIADREDFAGFDDDEDDEEEDEDDYGLAEVEEDDLLGAAAAAEEEEDEDDNDEDPFFDGEEEDDEDF